MEKSGFGKDGIYRSTRPALVFPNVEDLSMVSFLFRRTSDYSKRPALVDAYSGRTINFAELMFMTQRVANGLIRLGFVKGDVILLFAPNSLEYPICFLGIVAFGAVATTANPMYTVREIETQVKDSAAKLVITVPELWEKVKDLGLPAVIIGSKSGSFDPIQSDVRVTYLSDLLEIGEMGSHLPDESVKQTDTAALLYSSGTTGTCKGVILTHQAFISVSLMVTQDQDLDGELPNVILCFIPMFHVFGLSIIVYCQIVRGNCVVVMSRFDLDMALRTVEKYKVTYLIVVPPVMIALAKQNWGKLYNLTSLKRLGSGAAPVGKDVMLACAKNFPHAAVVQGYGLTESCGIVSMDNLKDRVNSYGSVGPLTSGVESKIMSIDTLKPMPPNELGEIWIRGPNMMKGYHNNAQATMSTIDKQGWVHTGDLGYFDTEGRLFVVDRIKELIKYKGFQIAPAELEGLLISHPSISDAAVVPFPDAEAGEIPVAYVVLSPSCSVTGENIEKFVAGQVAPFKRLRRVIFVDQIPKSSSGKILRRELIKWSRSKL